MNKYQEAFNRIVEEFGIHTRMSDWAIIRESIEKTVPMKVVDNGYNIYFCDNCDGSVWQRQEESKYCFRCGQAIDWSETK